MQKHRRRLSIAWFALVITALAAPVGRASEVLVVGPPLGGSGVALLQQALDAATDGDIVLLKAGDYLAPDNTLFTIDGKDITVVPDAGVGLVEVRGFLISDVPEGGTVTLRGFRMFQVPAASGPVATLEVTTSEGHVWLEDCDVFGRDGLSNQGLFLGSPGKGLLCGEGTLNAERCSFVGGRGPDSGEAGFAAGGAEGVQGVGTFMSFTDCTIQGGDGGTGATSLPGVPGGTGLFVVGGPAYIMGCVVRGGDSGFATTGSTASSGGDGVFTFSAEPVYVRESTLEGGVATQTGPDGNPSSGVAPPTQLLGAPARSAQITAVAREGESAQLELTGEGGELVLLAFAFNAGYRFTPVRQGVLVLDLNAFFGPLPVAVLPPTGLATLDLAVPDLPDDGFTLHLQTLSSGGSDNALGAATATTFLAADI